MKPYYGHAGITIFHGDCREVLPMLGTIGFNPTFDLLCTDPPYGIGFAAQPTQYQRKDGHKPANWDDVCVDKETLALVLASARWKIVWGGTYYQLPLSRCWLAWTKPDGPPSFGKAEFAWTNFDKVPGYIAHSISATNGERLGHPTQKPEAVIRWAMQYSPEPFENVVDPFMGSGTTLRAAKDLERKAVGIEIEEKYCEIAAKRLSQEVLSF